MAYVDVRPIGEGFSNISISPDEIRITSKGFDTDGNLVFGEENVLVTNTPRTPNLVRLELSGSTARSQRVDNNGS